MILKDGRVIDSATKTDAISDVAIAGSTIPVVGEVLQKDLFSFVDTDGGIIEVDQCLCPEAVIKAGIFNKL